MSHSQIVIIGAGYAGVLAALRLSRARMDVTLVSRSDQFVERIRMHQYLVSGRLPATPICQMLPGVNFIQGEVTALDPDAHQVMIGQQAIHYDRLVYALGSYTDTSKFKNAPNLYALEQTSVARLRAQLPVLAARQGRLLIVGGGLTGIEAATELKEGYPSLEVSLLSADTFGAAFSAKGASYVRRRFAELGIPIRDCQRVVSVEADALMTSSGERVGFDACLWTAGFAVSSLARDSGLQTTAAGQIVVDDHLRSVSHADIFAVGDAANVMLSSGHNLRMACATALPMGAYTADSLVAESRGKTVAPFRFGYGGRCISLGRRAGLVQIVNSVDKPVDRIITGRTGAIVKELICRYARTTLTIERWPIPFYFWPQPQAAQTNPLPGLP